MTGFVCGQSIDFRANAYLPENEVAENKDAPSGLRTGQKVWILNGSVIGGLGIYGSLVWWRDFQDIWVSDDGWFGPDADNGGADKTGHGYSTYVFSRVFSDVYRKLGMSHDAAAWQGPLFGFSLMALLEFGDSVNQYGFSPKDIIANGAGSLLAFISEKSETFDSFVDFRVEYYPSRGFRHSGESDIFTDYSGMKHLLVFKLSGFESLDNSPFSYLEFQAGYFTRGFKSYDEGYIDTEKRAFYGGISVNFSRIFRKIGEKSKPVRPFLSGVSTFLEYYQPPYTSLTATHYMY